jgi:hypothetical protein
MDALTQSGRSQSASTTATAANEAPRAKAFPRQLDVVVGFADHRGDDLNPAARLDHADA